MNEEILERLSQAIRDRATKAVQYRLEVVHGTTLTQYAKKQGRLAKDALIMEEVDKIVDDIVNGKDP